MSAVHLHLMLNHLPVVGSLIGILLLAVALLRRSSELAEVTLGLFGLLGAASLAVFLTGEPAEELVEKLPGFSESITHAHEEVAEFATIVMVGFGVLALGALAAFRRHALPRWVTAGGLALALVAGGLMGYTGYLGGQVRHTEVRAGAGATPAGDQEVTSGDRVERDEH
jgi:uncharacterized membrane protein